MTWLTPMLAIKAASITIPLLVLLYFLKLKRRRVPVSSTLLWKRAVQDLQVNAPFQRLRRNILLFLQLLAMAAVLIILGSPVSSWRTGGGERFVLLIDRSASMQAADVQPSRLESAKQAARDFLKTLRPDSLLGQGDQAMIIAFAAEPQVVCPFVSNPHELRRAIDSIQPTDGQTKIAEAIRIARAFATPTDPDTMGRSSVAPARLVLFSDGHIADSDKVTLRRDEMTVFKIGESSRNVAITAFQARRSFDDPDQVSVFVGLSNYQPKAADTTVQLLLNRKTAGAQRVNIPPGKTAVGNPKTDPGQTGVTFTLNAPEGGIIEVRQVLAQPDDLAVDNSAYAVLEPPERFSVLLVGPGNLVLEEALRSLPLARLDLMSPDDFSQIDTRKFETEKTFNVVVLDRCTPKALPRSAYLVFGPPPPIPGLSADGPHEDQFIIDWRPNHPALRFVNFENVYARNWWKYTLPSDAYILAESDRGSALAMIQRQGISCLTVNFDVLGSNWPFRPGFVIFLYNAIRLLGNPAAEQSAGSLAIDSSLNFRLPPDTFEARIVRPDGTSVRRQADPGGFLRYAPLDRVGIYRVQPAGKTEKSFAVNLLDTAESDIAPASNVAFSGERVSTQKAGIVPQNEELRPFFLIVALVILCLEWFIYNKKVQI